MIPSTGFFEWKRIGGKAGKEKYHIRLPGQPMLYMAGLYKTFEDRQGKPYTAFVILTVAANPSIAPLHDRMPLVLEGDERDAWLRDYGTAVRLLHGDHGTPLSLTPTEPIQQSFF